MRIEDLTSLTANVISLECQPGRYVQACEELSRVGFKDIKRVNAFDGVKDKEYLLTRYKKFGIPDTNFVKLGYVGLAFTAYDLFKQFLDTSDKYLMFFEDDVIAHSSFLEEFKKFEDLQLDDFDVCFLGGIPINRHPDLVKNKIEEQRMLGKHWIEVNTPLWQTHAMIVGRKTAAAFVRFAYNLSAIDTYITAQLQAMLKKEGDTLLRQVCLISEADSSENYKNLTVKIGPFKAYGPFFQRKGAPSHI